jgi:hypothetical protein
MSKKSMFGVTRQGVRDLSSLKGKSPGRKVNMNDYPVQQICSHPMSKRIDDENGWEQTCFECGKVFQKRFETR